MLPYFLFVWWLQWNIWLLQSPILSTRLALKRVPKFCLRFKCLTFILSPDYVYMSYLSSILCTFMMTDHLEEKQETLGEILNGDRLVTAPYNVKFLQRKDREVACAKKLTSEEVSQIQAAIKQDYLFQMYCDDLPIWGFVGRVDRSSINDSEHKYLLYQHLEFEIFFNKDQIIETHLLMRPNEVVELTEGREMDIKLLYSVHWIETNAHFHERMKKYSAARYSTRHLFSIINSCVTFLILFGCLLIYYMRVIRKDFYE